MIQIEVWTLGESWSAKTSRSVARTAVHVASKSMSGGPYAQIAVTLVAISRSSVSARVVYGSRGKPENAERVVFMTMRSSMPASTTVASRPTATKTSCPLAGPEKGVGGRSAADVDRSPGVFADIDGRAIDLFVRR